MDCGDYVVIVNAKHVQFSGSKWDHKYYTYVCSSPPLKRCTPNLTRAPFPLLRWHTGWAGGLKRKNARIMKEQNPGMILRKAILRMIKKTPVRFTFR
jgi:large subunit ribosomal protein L13